MEHCAVSLIFAFVHTVFSSYCWCVGVGVQCGILPQELEVRRSTLAGDLDDRERELVCGACGTVIIHCEGQDNKKAAAAEGVIGRRGISAGLQRCLGCSYQWSPRCRDGGGRIGVVSINAKMSAP